MNEERGESVTYRPGVCNIGTGERRRRRRAGFVGFALGVLTVFVVIGLGLSDRAALASAAFFSMGAIGYLQARWGFCAYYGATGQYNLSSPSDDPAKIDDEDARKRDRRTSIRIVLAGIGLGFGLGLAGYLLAVLL
ncbi:MAG: hypothetical protein ABEJ58_09195 [Halodesulfurarchaeum sp.]